MLTPDILDTVRQYASNLDRLVTFALQTGEHSKRPELKRFLQQLADTSDYLNVIEGDFGLRSPISFELSGTGIQFSGIPGGHEFNSLILAILQTGGTPIKLDDSLQSLIRGIEQPLNFEVFISLSCHNCPDVVQALNQFALLNPNIRSEMIDGGLFQDQIAARDIQGVPSVYLNGELFANGKVTAAQLIDKLIERVPTRATVDDALPLQDVVVVGGGPAGVSAAIYTARKGLAVTLIADRIGGQVKDTMGIENLIGVPSTTGHELSGQLAAHIADYDIRIKEHLRVTDIHPGDIKTLTLSSGEQIRTKTLIIATGAKWRELGVPGEKENIGNGVAYCPHCDGPFYKGKNVAVIGGGNSGIEAALDLAGIVKSVTVIEFGEQLRADQVLIDQASRRDNIRIITHAETQSIDSAQGKVSGLTYLDRSTGAVEKLKLEGVFVQIGLVPNSAFVAGWLDTNRHGEIIVNERGHTHVSGVFACGDVTTVLYKQIVISMGEGAKAALAAFEYLMAHGDALNDTVEVAA